MKTISEMTELEILSLTDEDVSVRIKLKKAEEGIQLIDKPQEPSYFNIEEPNITVYTCGLFGDDLVFQSIEELTNVVESIKKAKTKTKLSYDYSKLGSDFKYLDTLKSKRFSDEWSTISSNQVYSSELYSEISTLAMQNKKLKETYEKDLKSYHSALQESKWIEDEINEQVSSVRGKYYKMDNYARKFKNDYLPLANNDENVAMKFLEKAYNLSDEEQKYVFENYSKIN